MLGSLRVLARSEPIIGSHFSWLALVWWFDNHVMNVLNFKKFFSTAIPIIQPLSSTNPSIIEDRLVGTLIVTPLGFPNLPVIVNVISDPCPDVQWAFNGVNFTTSHQSFVVTPTQCNSSFGVLPYANTLVILNSTLATSGEYTAMFSHLGGSQTISIYVTVPGIINSLWMVP